MKIFKALSKLTYIFPIASLIVPFPSWAGTIVAGVQILEPNELVAGKTQSQWGDLWWQWAANIPSSQNPLVFDDNTDPLGQG